jgi:hypothetical protein
MQMIWHQAVGGAERVLAGSGVEHEFAERGVKGRREPAARTFLQGVRPEDDGVSLVTMFFQSRKFSFARRSHRGNEVDFFGLDGFFDALVIQNAPGEVKPLVAATV